MNDWPRITIVTPNFNGAPTLEATLRSVLEQDYPNLEYIVLDGGSSDGSTGILERYSRQLTSWESAPDRGQADALNKGFSRATGEIFGFLNSDDTYLPGALRAVAETYVKNGRPDLLWGRCLITDANNVPIREHHAQISSLEDLIDLHRVWWRQRQFIQPEVFWTAAIARRAGPFRADLHIAFDYAFWLEVFSLQPRLAAVGAPLAAHRRHPGQKTNDAQRVATDVEAVARDWLARRPETIAPLRRWQLLGELDVHRDLNPVLAVTRARAARWWRALCFVLRHPQAILARSLWQRASAATFRR